MSWVTQARRVLMAAVGGVLPGRGRGHLTAHTPPHQNELTGGVGPGGADLAAWPGLSALDERLATVGRIVAVSSSPDDTPIVALAAPSAVAPARVTTG